MILAVIAMKDELDESRVQMSMPTESLFPLNHNLLNATTSAYKLSMVDVNLAAGMAASDLFLFSFTDCAVAIMP